jgi:hypothetical protein
MMIQVVEQAEKEDEEARRTILKNSLKSNRDAKA